MIEDPVILGDWIFIMCKASTPLIGIEAFNW